MTIEAIQYHTRHFSKRLSGSVIDSIIIHDTGGKTAEGTLKWFDNEISKVSSHYLIDKDGTLYECVPVEEKAWHAGTSTLFGKDNVNDFSIGIELVDDNDADKYPKDQIAKLIDLCTELALSHHISLNRIVGHEHIAPGRKVDPGKDFPWYEFLVTIGANLY